MHTLTDSLIMGESENFGNLNGLAEDEPSDVRQPDNGEFTGSVQTQCREVMDIFHALFWHDHVCAIGRKDTKKLLERLHKEKTNLLKL